MNLFTYSTFAFKTGLLPWVTEARIANLASVSLASKSADPIKKNEMLLIFFK